MSWWRFWEREEGAGGTPDYYEEGVALASQERFHEALTSFRLALRERPDDPATLEQMAVVYTHIGVTDQAVKLYRKALAFRYSPSAHYGLAFLLLRRGEAEEAAEHLRSFLGSAPRDPEAAEHIRHARETLERLRADGPPDEDAGGGPRDGVGTVDG